MDGRSNHSELRARLQARRTEIEQVLLTRVHAVADSSAADPVYLDGLHAAVGAALDYGLEALEHGETPAPPIPVLLLAQARVAARYRVDLGVVLRRYLAGYTLLGDLIVQEAETMEISGRALKRLLRGQCALFDRLLAAVTEEYRREQGVAFEGTSRTRGEQVKRLLEGDLLDPTRLPYDFRGFHTGLVALGRDAEAAIGDLARATDRRLLIVDWPDGVVWAWLGGRRPLDPAEFPPRLDALGSVAMRLALGEPGEGLTGWRHTHRQAKAMLPVLLRTPDPILRYSEVALLVSAMQDELLVRSLQDLYLAVLERERDGGEAAKETLRAYFAAGRNVSSAAAVLGISRQAVANRLRQIEERIGTPVERCAAELEIALRIERLGDSSLANQGSYGLTASGHA